MGAVTDGARQKLALDAFSVCEFLRDGAAMMGRSLTVAGLSVCAVGRGSARLPQQHGSVLAAHSITMQLWMLTSYIVDGFADVGTMLGSKLLGMLAQGSGQHRLSWTTSAITTIMTAMAPGCGPIPARRMRRLVRRVLTLALGTGLAAAVALAPWRQRPSAPSLQGIRLCASISGRSGRSCA